MTNGNSITNFMYHESNNPLNERIIFIAGDTIYCLFTNGELDWSYSTSLGRK
jgi:hypothetical protein